MFRFIERRMGVWGSASGWREVVLRFIERRMGVWGVCD